MIGEEKTASYRVLSVEVPVALGRNSPKGRMMKKTIKRSIRRRMFWRISRGIILDYGEIPSNRGRCSQCESIMHGIDRALVRNSCDCRCIVLNNPYLTSQRQ